MIAGFRTVRVLGSGARAEVMLAMPDDDSAPVALKVYRGDVDEASIAAELEALERAAGEHVVELLDAACDDDGRPVAVLQRIPGPALDRVLRDRAGITAGEAVTILAPLAVTVARLHDAGVLHGGISPEAVLFDERGAPVLAAFGRARVVASGASPAARALEPGFDRDHVALETLAAAVLHRVAQTTPAITGLAAADLAAALFAWADAEPVRLAGDVQGPALPARVLRSAPVTDIEPPQSALALGVPDWLARMLPQAVPDRIRDALAALRAVRRPVWIAAALGAVGLVTALVLVPATASPDAVPRPEPTASPPAVGPVMEDDPVAAAVALLAERERCLRDLSILCLDAVDQPGSPALRSDQSQVRAVMEGSGQAQPIAAGEVQLVERLGDSALVSLGVQSDPASLLLMRSEAGWRIREYLTG